MKQKVFIQSKWQLTSRNRILFYELKIGKADFRDIAFQVTDKERDEFSMKVYE